MSAKTCIIADILFSLCIIQIQIWQQSQLEFPQK
jgi:hypothetical protein